MLGVGCWMFSFVSALQLFFIILTFAAPAAVWLYARREPDGRTARWLERGLALALLAFYAADLTMKWQDGALTLDNALPMQLCDWALFAVAAALWFRWRTCFEVAYFWGLAGTFQALFTPALPVANCGVLSPRPTTASMLDLCSDNHTLYVVQINLTAFVFFAVLYLPWLIIDLAHAKPKAANGDPAATSTRQA